MLQAPKERAEQIQSFLWQPAASFCCACPPQAAIVVMDPVVMSGDAQRLCLVWSPPPCHLGLQDQDKMIASRAFFQLSQPELKDKQMMA